MKTILLVIVLLISYAIIRFVLWYVSGFVRVTLTRRKIAKLDRQDRMDNGNRLKTYFLEIDEIKQRMLDKYPGQFPPGDEGQVVQQLAGASLMCLEQNPRVCMKAVSERHSNESG